MGIDYKTSEYLFDILAWAIEQYDLPDIELKIKNVQCSRARRTRRNKYAITHATWWSNDYGLEAAIADLLHEIAHIIQRVTDGYMSHDRRFRAIEIQLLHEFGLVPKQYKKAYYRRLETISGKKIYQL